MAVLKTNKVAFSYINNQPALVPTTLEIPTGSINLITGSSGSGKSTLARCLTGLIPHLYRGEFSGQVWLNGYQTTEVPVWRLAEKAGMVFQNPTSQMLAPTVEDEVIFGLENLGLQREEISARLYKAYARFDLKEFRKRSPLTLSGGEQQKLALAAFSAREPDVLVLDEPLSMLDTTSAVALISYLEKLAEEGVTVVVCEHRQEYFSGVDGLHTMPLVSSPKYEIKTGFDFPEQSPFNLEVRGLTVNFNQKPVIKDLNLSFKSGEVVAIVGRNGVGKTTLLRAMAGLQQYQGQVWVSPSGGNQPVDVSMVFQNPDLQLFNPTVREEILYRVTDPDLEYYQHLITALGLKPYENLPPLLLSEGEKKRLTLGMVLIRLPKHGLLLDEPSLGQDSTHKTVLIRLLNALADAGRVVVMTTHDLSLASQADRLVLLGTAGVIANGETSQVFSDKIAWEQAGIIIPDWFQRDYPGWFER